MPETVIIAEDEVPLAYLQERALKKEGLDPVVVGNGAEVPQVLAERPHCRLVVTDQSMPRGDGHTVVEHIASREANGSPPTPIIILWQTGTPQKIADVLDQRLLKIIQDGREGPLRGLYVLHKDNDGNMSAWAALVQRLLEQSGEEAPRSHAPQGAKELMLLHPGDLEMITDISDETVQRLRNRILAWRS